MSGVFATWQPAYAERGIATFPVGETKRPSIKGWQKVGLCGSEQLAAKFSEAEALGYVTGRRSKVTVLDIDATDERLAEDAIRRHGLPAIVTRTASGKRHFLLSCLSTCSATMVMRSRPRASSPRAPTRSSTAISTTSTA